MVVALLVVLIALAILGVAYTWLYMKDDKNRCTITVEPSSIYRKLALCHSSNLVTIQGLQQCNVFISQSSGSATTLPGSAVANNHPEQIRLQQVPTLGPEELMTWDGLCQQLSRQADSETGRVNAAQFTEVFGGSVPVLSQDEVNERYALLRKVIVIMQCAMCQEMIKQDLLGAHAVLTKDMTCEVHELFDDEGLPLGVNTLLEIRNMLKHFDSTCHGSTFTAALDKQMADVNCGKKGMDFQTFRAAVVMPKETKNKDGNLHCELKTQRRLRVIAAVVREVVSSNTGMRASSFDLPMVQQPGLSDCQLQQDPGILDRNLKEDEPRSMAAKSNAISSIFVSGDSPEHIVEAFGQMVREDLRDGLLQLHDGAAELPILTPLKNRMHALHANGSSQGLYVRLLERLDIKWEYIIASVEAVSELVGLVKILFSNFQVLTAFTGNLEVDWPADFSSFTSSVNFVNLDFVEVGTPCMDGITFYHKMLYSLTWPLLLVGVLFGLVHGLGKLHVVKKPGVTFIRCDVQLN